MNKKRVTLVGILTVLLLAVNPLSALGSALPKVTIQSPATVGALPLIWIKESGFLDDQVDLDILVSPDHQRGLALIAQNEIELLVTGVNVGAKAYNKGIDLRLVNVNIWGIDYLLTGGFEARTWSDLEGKTLSLPLQGGPLDFLARYFLLENGADESKVKIVYQASNNGARSFQLGSVDAIILPEPLVTITLKNYADAVLSFDLQAEWAKLHDGDDRIPFVGLFVRGDFATQNSDLIAALEEGYRQGLEWVKANPTEAAVLAGEYFGQPPAIVQESFGRINLNLYPENETKMLMERYFTEIMRFYPEMIGGQLPDADFYL